MPKKFASENTKAVTARARKAAAQNEAQAKKLKEQEDEFWKDEDKHIMRKQQRKEGKEKKASEAAARKAANKAMAQEELDSIKTNKPAAPTKITRAEIQEDKEKKASEAAARKAANKAMAQEELDSIKTNKPAAPTKITRAEVRKTQETKVTTTTKEVKTHLDGELEENINKLIPTENEARSIEEAISVLSVSETPEDRHPEKRMKAVFTAFEEKNLPRLKKENPNMRLSQIKQLLKKEWMKSPENPMNQRFTQYNAK